MKKKLVKVVTAATNSALLLAATAGGAVADDLFDHSGDKSLFGDDQLFDDGPKAKGPDKDIEAAAVKAAKAQKEQALVNSMAVNDSQLFNQMRTVAGWVDNWVVFNHRFPEIGDESTYALQQLNELVPNNPYMRGSAYAVPGMTVDNAYLNNEGEQAGPPMSDGKVDTNHIVFIRDYGLTVPQVDEYSKAPPADWRANPGTITIITNDQYLFVVWGAGADGKPLRDLSSGRVRFAVGNYQRWDAPVMDMQVD